MLSLLLCTLGIGDKEFSWSVGSYLTKKHISPDKLKLGVGYVKVENRVTPPAPKKKKKDSNEFTVHKADQDWEYEVFYSENDSVVPYSRKEVWEKIGGKKGCLDKFGVFWPEDEDFIVSRVTRISKDASRMDLLKCSASKVKQVFTQSKNECYASYDQPVFTSPQKPVPLVVISSVHPDCQYEWKCFEKRDYSYPNTPVLYVNEPFLFKCSVTIKDDKVCEVSFDVSYTPIEDLTISTDSTGTLSGAPPSPVHYEAVTIQIPVPTFNCLDFTSTELCDATNDFDKRNELGKGGFGNVFRAYNLRCNGTDAAVKVLTRDGCKALKGGATESLQMKSELQALMKFRHANILPVMGYCFDENLKAIIYDYMKNGSLYDWIHNRSMGVHFLSNLSE